jgi:DNA-binding response OmpR family regulator
MTAANSKVLLISDDEESREAIRRMLKHEHLVPVVATDAQSGLERAFSARADVLLLDLGRPSTANMELCKQLRASRIRTPIVVLSQIEGETEKVLLLEAGADDCVVKPFGPRELLARIRALLRRARESTQSRAFGEIEVDLTRRIVTRQGVEVKLTRLEYNLLAYFLEHPGWVVTRDMVLNSVWGYDFYPNTRTVDAHVVRLRRKLKPEDGGEGYVRTVHGVGYRFVPEDDGLVISTAAARPIIAIRTIREGYPAGFPAGQRVP